MREWVCEGGGCEEEVIGGSARESGEIVMQLFYRVTDVQKLGIGNRLGNPVSNERRIISWCVNEI